jgi:MFS family permease
MDSKEPASNGPTSYILKLLSSLRNSSYRLYFFGTVCQFAAMSMQIVSNPLLIFYLTGKAEWLGIFSLVSAAPMLGMSVFGGAFADRLRKKKILIGGLVGSAITSVAVGLVLFTGILNKDDPSSWFILLATSAVQGLIMGLMMPAMMAIIPEIINREKLMNAIALQTTGMNTVNLIAPPIAGMIIAVANYEAVYFTMAGLYLCGATFILFIPARTTVTTVTGNILREMQKGFRYIGRNRLVLQILAFTLIFVVLSMPYQQFIPVYVEDILHTGATGSGLLNGVTGAGMLVGSLLLAAMPGKKRGLMLMGSGVLAGTALTIFSFSSIWALSLIIVFFDGLAQSFRNTIGNVLLQTYTENEYMGRVMSIINMQWGIMSLGTFLVGMIAVALPVQWVLGIMAILLIVFSLLFTAFVPSIRKVD